MSLGIRPRSHLIAWLALVLAASAPAAAAEVDAGARALVEKVVAAINGDDAEALKQLVHPRNLACVNEARAGFYAEHFAKETARTVPKEYKLTITDVGADDPLIFEEMDEYPVRPTHQMELAYNTGPYSGVSIFSYLSLAGGAWSYIIPCPTPAAVEMFRQASLQRRQQAARAEALFADLDDVLKAKLEALLAAGDRIGAMKRYAAETGEDLAMARAVVRKLQGN
jgi:hypothetical protein